MGPFIVRKVLSNNNYTIRKVSTRYTQTLHRIRIRPYVPEQRVLDVTVRSSEYLPEPNVKVSLNEWYAVSRKIDLGKQIDKHEAAENTSNNQPTAPQNVTDVNDKTSTPEVTENQIEYTNDVAPLSPVFSNLNTDIDDNPYIHHPHPLKVRLLFNFAAYSCRI